jgi:hypothetical protein
VQSKLISIVYFIQFEVSFMCRFFKLYVDRLAAPSLAQSMFSCLTVLQIVCHSFYMVSHLKKAFTSSSDSEVPENVCCSVNA